MKAWLIAWAGKLPPSLRQAVLTSPLGQWVHQVMGALAGQHATIVPLSGPLAGHRMRLDLRYGRGMAYGDYEPAVVQTIQSWVQPGWTVVDIGSQVGYMTLLLAQRVGPTGHVFAFEPMPANFAVLRENVALNAYENVTLVQAAVSNVAGQLRLHQLDSRALSATASLVAPAVPEAGGIDVATVRLDEAIPPARRPVRFVKIDVEGAEGWVLEGMADILARDRPILLVEIHPFAGGPNPALGGLTAAGYDVQPLNGPTQSLTIAPDYVGHILARPKLDDNTDNPKVLAPN